MFDYELGYTFANSWLHAGANFYYMDYKDQLVLTGELNEIGEAMASNVPDSYRTGIELMAGIKLDCGFQWDINATLSKNRVQNFTETLLKRRGRVGSMGHRTRRYPHRILSRLHTEQPLRLYVQRIRSLVTVTIYQQAIHE